MCLRVADFRNRPQQYNTASCISLLRPHLSSSIALFERCRHVRPLSVVLFKQPNRSLQVLSMQKPCLKAAASSPFRKGNATVVAGFKSLIPSTRKLRVPECKLLRFLLYSASQGGVVVGKLAYGPFTQETVVWCMQFASWQGALSMDALVSVVRV